MQHTAGCAVYAMQAVGCPAVHPLNLVHPCSLTMSYPAALAPATAAAAEASLQSPANTRACTPIGLVYPASMWGMLRHCTHVQRGATVG